ncbi:hypothetical protein [Sulfuricurvum sp.]|uniref:hypothetical protein n=1 Tax=Sulfuricurvum sp. TaxID=2025608 RepID=UPI003BB77B05
MTQALEVESLIKSWMPHMRVIEPQSLKEKIEADLKLWAEMFKLDDFISEIQKEHSGSFEGEKSVGFINH